MITLTPSGDILLEGLGKVGEYRPCPYINDYYDVYMEGYLGSLYTYKVADEVQQLLTNGFTPKKWEE